MTPDNIDTEALRKLRADACNLDGRSLMEVLHAQQKYERAIIAATPALLAAYDERDALKEQLDRLAKDLYAENVAASELRVERDALKAEVATLGRFIVDKDALNRHLMQQGDALKAEVERLRELLDLASYSVPNWTPLAGRISAAVRGEEASRGE